MLFAAPAVGFEQAYKDVMMEEAECVEVMGTDYLACPDLSWGPDIVVTFLGDVECISSKELACSSNIECANQMDYGCFSDVRLHGKTLMRSYKIIGDSGLIEEGQEEATIDNADELEIYIDPLLVDFSECSRAQYGQYHVMECPYAGKTLSVNATYHVDYAGFAFLIVQGINKGQAGLDNETLFFGVLAAIAAILIILIATKKKRQ